jgi:hypothetical protein
MLTFPLSIWITRRLDAPKGMAAALAQDGFNFTPSLRPTRRYAYPALGERIDLKNLVETSSDAADRRLADMLNGQLALLVAVDPSCGFCKLGKDQMKSVHDQITPNGISYSLVAFGPTDPEALSKYRDSISPDIHFFVWPNKTKLPQSSILEMPTPTHILVDREGTILRLWPGSSSEKQDRSRMATQIVSDTLAVAEAVDALTKNK